MITNTIGCSGLKLVNKLGFLPDDYQQMLEYSTSNTVSNRNKNNNNKNNNNNNNNNNYNNININYNNNTKMNSAPTILELKSTTAFTFYTPGGIHAAEGVGDIGCSNLIIEESSEESKETKLNSPLIVKSNEFIHCNPGSSLQDSEVNLKMFQNVHNDCALNGVVIGNGIKAVVAFTNDMDKTIGDNRINSSNRNNINNKSNKSDTNKSPMCRTEDQENAFRQIEDVHNYSKLNRYGYCNGKISETADLALYSSNSSDQDEEEDDEEDNNEDGAEEEDAAVVDYEKHLNYKAKILNGTERQCNKATKVASETSISTRHKSLNQENSIKIPEVEEKVTNQDEEIQILPDHHARRPMNAFLIFCKRHRGIVKDKYKNFENRSITKILGEWWASLDPNDKKSYVNLAKQNKDAFFSANPNFKWYKLPAPSLRTLNTRPGNIERPFSSFSEYQCDLNDSPTKTSLIYNSTRPSPYNRSELRKVEYFKLADETQMGELNHLMRPTSTTSTSEALHEALGKTSDYFKTSYKRQSFLEDVVKTKRLHNENSISSSEDELMPKKSARSCKGKKYQELINSGQISAVISKKQVSPKASGSAVSNANEQFATQNGLSQKVTTATKYEVKSPKKPPRSKTSEGQFLLADFQDSYESPSKQHFSFVSFDLEDKIKALPAQCLETYLQRKKNTKRKKKINSKKRQPKPETITSKELSLTLPKTAQEAKEQMVGSQKRKARKESITRRDINSIQNDVQLLLSGGSVSSVVIGVGISAVQKNAVPVPKSETGVNHSSTSDLLILAEVAANHTGIAQ